MDNSAAISNASIGILLVYFYLIYFDRDNIYNSAYDSIHFFEESVNI